MTDEKNPKKVLKIKRVKGGVRVTTKIKAGPSRRLDFDHVGGFNFVVEINGIH